MTENGIKVPTCPMCGKEIDMRNSMHAFGYYCNHCKCWRVIFKELLK